MSKTYLANTPLILQDENGEDVRVERGETVVLSDTQYVEVAAHVTLIDGQPETTNAMTSSHLAEEPPETPSENPSENPDTDKPKCARAKE